jgi:uroporphyrinogen-III synthase
MSRVVFLRPEPGCTASVARARAERLDAIAIPLSIIEPRDWTIPDPADFDGLLAGSANTFRHGGQGLSSLRNLPVLAVGQATARAAQKAGFSIERTGQGGLANVLHDLADGPARRLLRLGGEERVSLPRLENIRVEERAVYRVRTLPIEPDQEAVFRSPAIVCLHSAGTAKFFAFEAARLGLDRTMLRIAAIGPRVSAAAGVGWREIHDAARPDEDAMLALLRQMCNNPA